MSKCRKFLFVATRPGKSDFELNQVISSERNKNQIVRAALGCAKAQRNNGVRGMLLEVVKGNWVKLRVSRGGAKTQRNSRIRRMLMKVRRGNG